MAYTPYSSLRTPHSIYFKKDPTGPKKFRLPLWLLSLSEGSAILDPLRQLFDVSRSILSRRRLLLRPAGVTIPPVIRFDLNARCQRSARPTFLEAAYV